MLEKLIGELESKVSSIVGKLDKQASPNEKGPAIGMLLKAAMKNEWETAKLSCLWALDEKDPDFAMSLMRLAGDEAKHYQLLAQEIERRGESFTPENQMSPLYQFLETQKDTFSRATVGPFAREFLAVKRNELFLKYCERLDKKSVMDIYETIQKDEAHHYELGKKMMEKLLQTEEDYQKALKLIGDFLKVVDDIQEMVMLKKGLSYLPGC